MAMALCGVVAARRGTNVWTIRTRCTGIRGAGVFVRRRRTNERGARVNTLTQRTGRAGKRVCGWADGVIVPCVRVPEWPVPARECGAAASSCGEAASKCGTPTKAPSTRPQVLIKLADRLQHTLRPSASPSSELDEATPLRRARPEGVMTSEVWMKLVEYSQTLPQRDGFDAAQPSDERALSDSFLGDLATFRFLGVATRTPHTPKFSLEARGQSEVYMLRWVSTRGMPGPWREVASATVAA